MMTRSTSANELASMALGPAGGTTRPTSRQSTESTQSNGAHPSQLLSNNPDTPYSMAPQMPSAVWQQHRGSMSQNSIAQASQIHHPSFMQDSSLQQPPMQFTPNDSFPAAHSMSIDMSGQFDGSFDMSMDATLQDENAADGGKKKKGSSSSQANDVELRRLFRENQDKTLQDVAAQVMKDEKGPKSEKSKQIFGMIWLATHAKKSNSSVPRNRVFSSYATRCGTERVPPLNPASFGKLVRIIFPGITTRRLGVRGESKYHYVELSLIDDPRPERASMPRGRSMTVDATGRDSVKPTIAMARPQFGGDNAYFSPIDSPQTTTQPTKDSLNHGSLYLQNLGQDCGTQGNEAEMMQRPLRFQKTTTTPGVGDVQLELPSIEPYLPHGVDVDAVDSLTSVYRSHCLLAIDNFRFCKTEKLSDSYKSLVGLLTVPGQKLLAHPQIAAWIRACDWMKYQKMIPMLDMIILTQVPAKAMAHMDHVGTNICLWISQFFQNQPQHTQDAMLGPANLFASLLERFLRVNRAALHASKVLEDVKARTGIWNDWVTRLEPFNVLQNSLMWHGHKRTFHILTQEARYLLDPSPETSIVGASRVFEDTGSRSEFQLSEMQTDKSGASSAMIARLSRFLASLVHRFPGVEARTLLNYIEVTSSNISRNLTLNGAESLHDWWRIKVFLDEMSYWLAEKGGFLETRPDCATQRRSFWQVDNIACSFEERTSNPDPRTRLPLQNKPAKRDAYQRFGHNNNNLPPGSRAPLHSLDGQIDSAIEPVSKSKQAVIAATDPEDLDVMNDDSGIAMDLEDEFGMNSKYNNFVNGVQSSDPPDVVVC